MITICEFPGVRFYMDSTEVVVITFFPSGMPKELARLGIQQFIDEGKKIVDRTSPPGGGDGCPGRLLA